MPLDLTLMTNQSLVEYIKNNTAANAVELELAERLGEAVKEMDIVCRDLARAQAAIEGAKNGSDA